MIKALAKAMIDPKELPFGLNTFVRGSGIHMSENIAHKLSLARFYLRDSSLLLLDKLPNFIMQEEAGKILYEFLMENKGEKNIFISTDNKEIIKQSDVVIILDSNHSPIVCNAQKAMEILTKVGING